MGKTETVEARQARLSKMVMHRDGCPDEAEGVRVEVTFEGDSPKHGARVKTIRCHTCGAGTVRHATSHAEFEHD